MLWLSACDYFIECLWLLSFYWYPLASLYLWRQSPYQIGLITIFLQLRLWNSPSCYCIWNLHLLHLSLLCCFVSYTMDWFVQRNASSSVSDEQNWLLWVTVCLWHKRRKLHILIVYIYCMECWGVFVLNAIVTIWLVQFNLHKLAVPVDFCKVTSTSQHVLVFQHKLTSTRWLELLNKNCFGCRGCQGLLHTTWI